MSFKSIYPNISDPLFSEKLATIEEYGIYEIEPLNKISNIEEFKEKADSLCQFEKTKYQHLVSQYISPKSPYNGILLYHGLGSGKTCSAITIAEAFIKQQRTYSEPNIWIISKKSLKKSFEEEIFKTSLLLTPEYIRSQCTNDNYYKLIPNADKLDKIKLNKRIQQVIKSRYKFFGYEKFANTIENYINENILEEKIKDKVIIIDEAHNIRYLDTFTDTENLKDAKRIVEPLIKILKEGQDNRLVLLSATPMYNEPEEILWLLSLLKLNDTKTVNILDPYNIPQIFDSNNKPDKKILKLISELSSNYISYVRGNNPFTFAIRINPEKLGISTLKITPKNTLQNEKIDDNSWIKYIKDGLVPSKMKGIQLENMKEIISNKTKLSISTLRQMNNITYKKQLTVNNFEYTEGKKGLFTIFNKKDNVIPIQLEYINKKEPIFSVELLENYACKLYTISNLIRKSEGIIVIYSNFIWSGIIPTAIMLEHMGFSRYGENDILNMRGKVTKPITYEDIKNPKYCILSNEHEKELMGKSRIDDLLSIINSNENINGNNIKIVLMSPVASEGLSFKNVREIHILDPWYHLNTSEQAIGRAIRNCSHSKLPVEKRNVSVFLHTTILPSNIDIETEDLHAYRLSANKYNNIEKINDIIKSNAIDCNLLNNINYFPRDLFGFSTSLKLSNGKVIPYHYGDDTNMNIKCEKSKKLIVDTRSFREESYHNFIPTLQNKLVKKLKDNYKKYITSYSYEELVDIIHKNKELSHRTIEETLYPYKLWENYGLIYQYDMFYVTNFENKLKVTKPSRLQIEKEEVVEEVNKECNLPNILQQFMDDNEYIALINTYQSIDYNCWKLFAENIVLNYNRYLYIDKIIKILEKQGSFILENEIPNIKNENSKYIGYVNIFSPEDKFEVILWDNDNNQFREATPKELNKIISNRRTESFIDFTTIHKNTVAFIQRYENKKDISNPYIFQIKLLFGGKEKAKGIVCDTVKKDIIETEYNKLINANNKNIKLNKTQLCTEFIIELLKKNRLWIPPMYKPKYK